ncbi:hypothetical protein B0H13DRAFT_1860996 [Mycena leptocephala]|nr:hypothetical protein B0H13DRAFT_1860996 [Mycena leptocephala]
MQLELSRRAKLSRHRSQRPVHRRAGVWEKVKPSTFGTKGEEKVYLLSQRNATVSGRPAELSCGKVPPTETGRGSEMEASPRSPKKAEVEFKDWHGGYIIIVIAA